MSQGDAARCRVMFRCGRWCDRRYLRCDVKGKVCVRVRLQCYTLFLIWFRTDSSDNMPTKKSLAITEHRKFATIN